MEGRQSVFTTQSNIYDGAFSQQLWALVTFSKNSIVCVRRLWQILVEKVHPRKTV